jgi:predicted  nucleic acid-binding Zn-ribbon protein
MDVTSKLLSVFLVDKQLRGLQSRLHAAERFLGEQDKQLQQIDAKRTALETQVRQLKVTIADAEGQTKSIDERMAHLRDQMGAAKTNKEYKAFLTELNTYKADRDALETSTLEQMGKLDELKKQLAEFDSQKSEREKVRTVAGGDRDSREAEIKDRVAELKAQRAKLAAEVPADALKTLEKLIHEREDDAMAPLEEHDRRRHEYTCGSCMMALPVEKLSALLSNGRMTHCPSCGCLLYLEAELHKQLTAPASKR